MDRVHKTIIIAAASMLAAGTAWGGSLDAPAAPTAVGSAMFTTTDLYNRLASGIAGVKRSGAFSEPSGGPAPTGYTANQLMLAAPAADNLNGAIVSYVLVSKTFWGLRTDGTWGPKTGTRPPAPVPKTGQTTCYDPTNGNVVSCNSSTATGREDGALQRGVPPIGARFTNNSNGTVTDNLTGLIWLKDAMCTETVGGIVKSSENLNWLNALLWTHSLANGKCGLSDSSQINDWRLPNVKELQSLIDFGQPNIDNKDNPNPALPPGHPFVNANLYPSLYYWSSTADFNSPVNVWYVNMSTGQTNTDPDSNYYYVWPVRGGLSQ